MPRILNIKVTRDFLVHFDIPGNRCSIFNPGLNSATGEAWVLSEIIGQSHFGTFPRPRYYDPEHRRTDQSMQSNGGPEKYSITLAQRSEYGQ